MSSQAPRRCRFAALVLAAAIGWPSAALASRPPAQTAVDRGVLERDRAVAGSVTYGTTHAFALPLEANQLAVVVTSVPDFDLDVRLTDPAGETVAIADRPFSVLGPLTLYYIAPAAGAYRIEIRQPRDDLPESRYEVTLHEMRPATASDTAFVAGYNGIVSGHRQRAEGTSSSLEAATASYTAALGSFRTAGSRGGEGAALHYLGVTAAEGGSSQDASRYFDEAITVRQASGDARGEAATHNEYGKLLLSQGRLRAALQQFEDAAVSAVRAGDALGQTAAESNRACVLLDTGDTRQAAELFEKALELARPLRLAKVEATILASMGAAYGRLGDTDRQNSATTRAIELFHRAGDRRGEAAALANLGTAQVTVGDPQSAIETLQHAATLAETSGALSVQARALTSLAGCYELLGNDDRAAEAFQRARSIWIAVGDVRGQATVLIGIAQILARLGELDKAIEVAARCRELFHSIGDRPGEAAACRRLGWIMLRRRDAAGALNQFTESRALDLAQADVRNEAWSLVGLGRAHAAGGDRSAAAAHLDKALELGKATGNPAVVVDASFEIALIAYDAGELDRAQIVVEKAIAVIEDARTRITDEELRADYFSTVQRCYALYIDVLMRRHDRDPSAGFASKALEAAERARSRRFLDMLAEAGVDLRRGVPAELVAEERRLESRIAARIEARDRLLQLARRTPNDDNDLSDATADIERSSAALEDVRGRIRRASPAFATLTAPHALTTAEIQNVVGPGSVMLEYWLGPERSYVWVVSNRTVEVRALAPGAEITKAGISYLNLVTARSQRVAGETDAQRVARITRADADLPAAAIELSRLLLAPVAPLPDELRILVSGSGIVQYLPFGALPSRAEGNASPLVAGHEIVRLDSAAALATERSRHANLPRPAKTLAILADPVYSVTDDRVPVAARRAANANQQADAPPRLAGTRIEAARIESRVPPAERLELVDFAANRDAVLGNRLSDYRFVHFATHGISSAVNPRLSGLALSSVDERGRPRDGSLRYGDLAGMELRADLVVLSACKSALGPDAHGDGLLGLTQAFMSAGARSVVASLWNVEDRATAELMSNLYGAMLSGPRDRPAAALRSAQRAMIASTNEAWRHPFYWAPFEIHGEWR